MPLLGMPDTVTTAYPEFAPEGTVTVILVAFQLVAVAVVPLNATVLLPCVEPKFVPVIVTEAPMSPEVEDKPAIFGQLQASAPTLENIDGLLWFLYSVAIQSAERTAFEMRTSVSNPP